MVGIPENGIGGMTLSLWTKNKNRRMDSELLEDLGDALIHNHRVERKRKRITGKYVIACTIFACLNHILLGYDIGVMSGAIIFMQEDLKITEVQEEVLVGILSIVSILGSLIGGKTADLVGRKWTMALAALVFQIGVAIMAVAPSFQILMTGRLLCGVGIGLGGMIAPVYIAEIPPSVGRGFLTSFLEISINVGILLGYVSNFMFSGLSVHINWRIMLAVGILPSVFIGVALFIVPESPRWLVMQNQVEEARSVLLKTNENEAEVEESLAEIQLAAGIGNANKHKEKAVWHELLMPSPSVRRMLVTGLGIHFFQQITGTDATVYYSPEIFKDAGIKSNSNLLAATIAMGVAKTAFILVSTFLIDKLGRKPLLYVSTIGMTACLSILAFSLALLGKEQLVTALAILCICGSAAFFSVGIGPVCGVVAPGVFPLRLRAQAVAVGAVVNRMCSGFVSMSFLSLSRKMTFGGTFFIFSALSALLCSLFTPLFQRLRENHWSRLSCYSKINLNCREEKWKLETLSI
ncbi:hypothetical protein SLE2022_234990 [Rubroshorea leprosula]